MHLFTYKVHPHAHTTTNTHTHTLPVICVRYFLARTRYFLVRTRYFLVRTRYFLVQKDGASWSGWNRWKSEMSWASTMK